MNKVDVDQERDSSYNSQRNRGTKTIRWNQVVVSTKVADAVCVDWIDLGMQETPWGMKHQCQVLFDAGLKDQNGNPMMINRVFTRSFNPRTALRRFFKDWRGGELSDEFIQSGFTLESTIGTAAVIKYQEIVQDGQVQHLTILEVAPPRALDSAGTCKECELSNQ